MLDGPLQPGETVEERAQAHLTAAATHLHDATTMLLRSHNAGLLRCVAEDVGAHRMAILRTADTVARWRARIREDRGGVRK